VATDVIELSDAGWQRHDFYMRLALVVESGAKCLGSRVGAVIVRDNRVLGSGYNGTPAGYPNCTETERGCRRCALRIEQPSAGLAGRLYDICRTEKYFDAQKTQKDLAALRQIVKRAGTGGLKGALRAMGRACGQPRPPLDALSEEGYTKLAAEIGAMAVLRGEPRGW